MKDTKTHTEVKTMNTYYYATGCGVTIEYKEGANIKWFLDMVYEKGGTVTIERAES